MLPIASIDIFEKYAKINYNYNRTIKYVSILSMLNALGDNTRATSIVMPFWTVFYVEKPDSIILLTVDEHIFGKVFNYKDKTNESKQLKLHYPYLYFYWTINRNKDSLIISNVNMYTSYDSPNDNTQLFIPKISHVFEYGGICWGNNNVIGKDIDPSLSQLVEFKNAFFNADFLDHINKMSDHECFNDKIFMSFQEWKASNLIHDHNRSYNGITIGELKNV